MNEKNSIESKLESLSEKCSQPPLLEFEGFIIRPFDEYNFWFECPGGEGTTMRKITFLATLEKLFDEIF